MVEGPTFQQVCQYVGKLFLESQFQLELLRKEYSKSIDSFKEMLSEKEKEIKVLKDGIK